jgi:hypothetical protein
MLGDGALHQKLSRNARLTAANYSWPRTGARFIEIIKGSLENDSINYCKSVRAGSASR